VVGQLIPNSYLELMEEITKLKVTYEKEKKVPVVQVSFTCTNVLHCIMYRPVSVVTELCNTNSVTTEQHCQCYYRATLTVLLQSNTNSVT